MSQTAVMTRSSVRRMSFGSVQQPAANTGAAADNTGAGAQQDAAPSTPKRSGRAAAASNNTGGSGRAASSRKASSASKGRQGSTKKSARGQHTNANDDGDGDGDGDDGNADGDGDGDGDGNNNGNEQKETEEKTDGGKKGPLPFKLPVDPASARRLIGWGPDRLADDSGVNGLRFQKDIKERGQQLVDYIRRAHIIAAGSDPGQHLLFALTREVFPLDDIVKVNMVKQPAQQEGPIVRCIRDNIFHFANKVNLDYYADLPAKMMPAYKKPKKPTDEEQEEEARRILRFRKRSTIAFWRYIGERFLPGYTHVDNLLDEAERYAVACATHMWHSKHWSKIPLDQPTSGTDTDDLSEAEWDRRERTRRGGGDGRNDRSVPPHPNHDVDPTSLRGHIASWGLDPRATATSRDTTPGLAWQMLPKQHFLARADFMSSGHDNITWVNSRSTLDDIHRAWNNGRADNDAVAAVLDDPQVLTPAARQRMIKWWDARYSAHPPRSMWEAFLTWHRVEVDLYAGRLSNTRAKEGSALEKSGLADEYNAAYTEHEQHEQAYEAAAATQNPRKIIQFLEQSPFPIAEPSRERQRQLQSERSQRLIEETMDQETRNESVLGRYLLGRLQTRSSPQHSPAESAAAAASSSHPSQQTGTTQDSLLRMAEIARGTNTEHWTLTMERRIQQDPNDRVALRYFKNPARFVRAANQAIRQRYLALEQLAKNPRRRSYFKRRLYPADDPRWEYELDIGEGDEEEESDDGADDADRRSLLRAEELPERARRNANASGRAPGLPKKKSPEPPPRPEYDILGRKRRYWVYLRQGDPASGLYDLIADQAYKVTDGVVYLPPAGRIVRYTAPPNGTWLGHRFTPGGRSDNELEDDALEELVGIDDEQLTMASSTESDSTQDPSERDSEYVDEKEEERLRARGAPLGEPVTIAHQQARPPTRPSFGEGGRKPSKPLLHATLSGARQTPAIALRHQAPADRSGAQPRRGD